MYTVLLIVLVALTGFQETHESVLKNNDDFMFTVELLNIDSYNARNSRDISALWDKIKAKIVNAWESLKKITNKAKLRVKAYMEKVEEKIEMIKKSFENKLEDLKNEFKKLLETVAAAEENFKKCLKDDKNVIEKLMKEILANVTTCITDNMGHLTNLDLSHETLDDKVFLDSIQNKIEEKLDTCKENSDKCLHNAEDEIIGDIDNATWNVSYKTLEARNAVDDGLDMIITCVTEGLTKASSSIFNETVQIIQCVKDKQ